jgi:Protein of unknown function (DUF3054)
MPSTPLPTTRRGWVAPALDAVAIGAFVLVGAGQHKIHEGAGWFLTVLWPLALGWFVVALGTRLYATRERSWLRLGATLAGGTVAGMALRGAFTDHAVVPTFAIVYLLWMTLITFGWRGVVLLLRQRRARAA